MKKHLFILTVFISWIISLGHIQAQPFRLDVEGDVKIRGKMDIVTAAGESNVAIGANAFDNNTSGGNNTAIGFNALRDNTLGENNTALGLSSLLQNEDGNDNTAIGFFALGNNQDGFDNTAIGSNALGFGTEGFGNTAVGKDAMFFLTSSFNSAFGYSALGKTTTGGANLAVGSQALINNITGSLNVAIGNEALAGNVSGNQNTAIGAGANVGSGNLSNATAIGSGARANESNSLILGSNANVGIGTRNPAPYRLKVVHGSGGGLGIANNSGNQWQIFSSSAVAGNMLLFANFNFRGSFNGTSGVYTAASDRRLKQNIKPLEPVLEKVLRLEPSRYQFTDNNPKKEETIGFIAQNVERLFPEFVFKSEEELSKGLYTMDYSGFGILAVKAIQEQQQTIEDLQEQNRQIFSDKEVLQQKVEDLEEKLNKLYGLAGRITALETDFNACCLKHQDGNTSDPGHIESASDLLHQDNARLFPNQPNPFSSSTTVRYFIPEEVSQAELLVSDLTGKLIKRITVQARGAGQTIFDATTLGSGTYQYSLILDGNLLDTKQMVLTKR